MMKQPEQMQQKLDKLRGAYDLLSEKIVRLRRARIIETDTAVLFKFDMQLREIEEERQRLEQEISDLEREWARKFEDRQVKNMLEEGQIENRYDVLFCYHPLDRDEVEAIVLSQNLKVLSYELEEATLFRKQVDSIAVFVGKMEPWRDNRLGKILVNLTDQKIPVIDVILKGVKGDPKFPFFLKTNRVVDFRKYDNPIETLETFILEVKEVNAEFRKSFDRRTFSRMEM